MIEFRHCSLEQFRIQAKSADMTPCDTCRHLIY